MTSFTSLLAEIRACRICAANLLHGVRPILQISPEAKILIAGQAPGRKVHESGIPFDDASGERLRAWMGIDRSVFYDASKIAILPMGFCYPGKGTSRDLPPRNECAAAWRKPLLDHLRQLQLMLVIGKYAQDYHLNTQRSSLTKTIRDWQTYWSEVVPLPHPSPRNNIWLSKNLWFEEELLPVLRQKISEVLEVNEC